MSDDNRDVFDKTKALIERTREVNPFRDADAFCLHVAKDIVSHVRGFVLLNVPDSDAGLALHEFAENTNNASVRERLEKHTTDLVALEVRALIASASQVDPARLYCVHAEAMPSTFLALLTSAFPDVPWDERPWVGVRARAWFVLPFDGVTAGGADAIQGFVLESMGRANRARRARKN